MDEKYAKIGTRVRSLVDFAHVPKGTEGVIDEDYGSGVTVAWDLPGQPLPPGYREWNGKAACVPGQPLRDGFGKDFCLQFLEVLSEQA